MYNQREEGNPISAQGYLITHVYTSDAMIPLEDSTVTITQKQLDGIEELLQVFPNTVTRQDLQMIPLNEMPEAWNQTEIFDVPPQNL